MSYPVNLDKYDFDDNISDISDVDDITVGTVVNNVTATIKVDDDKYTLKNSDVYEEIKIKDNKDAQKYQLSKRIEQLDAVSNAYKAIIHLVKTNTDDINRIKVDVNDSGILMNTSLDKIVSLSENLITGIKITLMKVYNDKELFTTFTSGIKSGYPITYNLPYNDKMEEIYFVESYLIDTSSNGLGMIQSFGLGNVKEGDFRIGAKYKLATSKDQLLFYVKEALNNNKLIIDFFEKKYINAASAYNTLVLIYKNV